ncbi:MAG: Pyrrolo-quinoline quinone [Bacilli bacterium]|nr:Pyrrolo-quinoline quinone [Bacilli bacterium]
MKKLAALGLLALTAMVSCPAFADTPAQPALFGTDVQRTHNTMIHESFSWSSMANVLTATTTDGSNSTFNLGGGAGTAIAGANILVFPVSKSASLDPSVTGYLTAYDLSNWANGADGYLPKLKWAVSLPGVSSSSPVIANGNVYLAAGDTLYQFDLLTGQNTIPRKMRNLYADVPKSGALQNQVSSHPLYLTAAQQGTSSDSIWVSSRNGWLFAIDPATLSQQAAISLGTRMDASPSLVTDTAGHPYIAVATAWDGSNSGGVGTVYLIDPRTDQVAASISSPIYSKSGAVLTAPIATSQGVFAWNDMAGDVFVDQFAPDHSILQKGIWMGAGGSGQMAGNEAGYSYQTGQYILGMSSEPAAVLVDVNHSDSIPVSIALSGSATSAPVISNDNIYIGDSNGNVDVIANTPNATLENAPQIKTSSSQTTGIANPVTVAEYMLGAQNNPAQSVPTLTINASDGLHIWQSVNQSGTAFADVFQSKYVNPGDLVDGRILQQSPYVVVSAAGSTSSNLLSVLEYVGQGANKTGAWVTYWKSEQVNKTTGNVVSILGNALAEYPVQLYPKLLPPADGQGWGFGYLDPANPVWATGSGLNVTPVPGWNPTVVSPPVSGFADVPDTDRNVPYITDLYQKYMINGTGNGNFSPNAPLTREQFAKMAVLAFQVPLTALSAMPFTDVQDDWAGPYVASAYAAKITKGTDITTFSPLDSVTREQAAAMVWRYISVNGVAKASGASSYDATDADSWAVDAVQNVMALGLRAEGAVHVSFGPQNVMTRGDAAALIDLAMQQLASAQSASH